MSFLPFEPVAVQSGFKGLSALKNRLDIHARRALGKAFAPEHVNVLEHKLKEFVFDMTHCLVKEVYLELLPAREASDVTNFVAARLPHG